MHKRIIIPITILCFCLVMAGFLAYRYLERDDSTREYLPVFGNRSVNEAEIPEGPNQSPVPTATTTLDVLPKSILNSAPFVPQAPFANWDELHEEACEEAAVATAHFYRIGKKELSADEAERELLGLIHYEEEHFGAAKDINADEMVRLATGYYQDSTSSYRIEDKYSLTDLKRYLALGNVIIVPAAGRVLDNPNFKQPGPLYHALVLIGYDDNKQQFITNDPGTRKGAGFRYSYDNLLDSIHDFPGDKEKILEGKKTVIIVSK